MSPSQRALKSLPLVSLVAVALLLGPWATPADAQHCHEATEEAGSEHAAAPTAEVEAEREPAREAVYLDDLNVPDLELVDQDGRPVRLYSDLIDGKVVALSFIFTTCTTICPPIGANFGRLETLLEERGGPPVHLVSVSIDPQTDTPERLKAWRGKFSQGEDWTLLTGEQRTVDRLLKDLGVFTPDAADHTPTILLGDGSSDRWVRVYGLASPSRIASVLEDLVGSGARAATLSREERP